MVRFQRQDPSGFCLIGDSQTSVQKLHDPVHYSIHKTWEGKAAMDWRNRERLWAEGGNAQALLQKTETEVLWGS